MHAAQGHVAHPVEVTWEGWPHGVTEAVLHVARAIAAARDGDALTVAITKPPNVLEQRNALCEALRGLVHSSVRERPQVRVNLMAGGDDESRAKTRDYLADATFVYGATVDLGGPG